MFPMLGEMEVTSCRTFIEEMVAKIDEGEQHLPKKFGRGFLRVSKKVQAINELVSSPTSSSFSGRKPHLVSYMPLRRGACSITMLGDVKGRSSNGDFPDAEVGHILDMARVLMTEHQFTRPFLIVFLTDGFRFQYFKCSRQSSDTFKYTSSIVYTETAGWQVTNPVSLLTIDFLDQILLGLLMLTHLDLGLVLDNIPGWNLVKGLGTGRFARVYAAQECDSDSGPVYVLKVFQNCQIGIHEENILSRLAHLNIANIPVVHTSVRPLDGTFGLLVTPIGMPILPAPSGMVINPLMFNKLLEVLETVHGLGIIHRDVKPENIILLGEGEIILDDWGSAVDINSSCSYQGTPVYGVENQGVQIATRALDLHCLVKTVFTIKQQNFPPSGLNWKQIQEHWTGISKTFPLFPTVLDCADNEDYESLRRYFSDLWC